MLNLIDGRALAEQIHTETAGRVAALSARGVEPSLVFVRVGEDPASKVYVDMKARTSARLGIRSETRVLPASTSEKELLEILTGFNADPKVHGILVQTPLPSHIRTALVTATIDPRKDVDGFHPINGGKLLLGDASGFRPCTPAGIHEMLLRCNIATDGAEVVVLGRGDLVGKPMAAILCQKGRGANSTVTLCHSRTRHIENHCRRADILIAAIGVPEFVKANMVRPGATVIDVGVNRVADPTAKSGTRLVGDVAFAEVQPLAGRITPNPGGVGPMTIAMLMQNTVRAAEMAHSL